MGAALRRTAFSPNIKERRDYSCAVFDGAGNVIAMGDHMPVHLGSMPMSVRAAIDAGTMEPGDVVMLNDPFRGGTHLPDITLVAPVYVARVARPHWARRLARERWQKEVCRCNQSRFLCGVAGASCGRRRRVSGIDGAVPRNLSGGCAHPSGETDAPGSHGCGCARDAAQQRAHSGGTRGRPGSADRGLPYRRRAPARSLLALRRGDAPGARRAICWIIPRN